MPRRKRPRRRSKREGGRTRPPRRPRALLPAAPGRPVHRGAPSSPSAAPFHDWNARIDAECYRPNAERGTSSGCRGTSGQRSRRGWPTTRRCRSRDFVAADRPRPKMAAGNAMAQAPPPLDPAAGLGRRSPNGDPLGDPRLRVAVRSPPRRVLAARDRQWISPRCGSLAAEGVRYTILAPWQAGEPNLDTRRPYRVELGGGRTIVVAFYDAGLSGAVSFEPSATSDADRFARERVTARLAGTPFPDGEPGLVVIATDGELYGHHQQFRDLFLQRLVAPGPGVAGPRLRRRRAGRRAARGPGPPPSPDRRSPTGRRGAAITAWPAGRASAPMRSDGRWKGPLRAALERPGRRDRRGDRRVACRAAGRPGPRRGARRLRRRRGRGADAPRRSRRLARRGRPGGDRQPGSSTCSRPSAGGWRCSPATAGSGTTPSGRRRARSCAARRGRPGWSTGWLGRASSGGWSPTWRSWRRRAGPGRRGDLSGRAREVGQRGHEP